MQRLIVGLGLGWVLTLAACSCDGNPGAGNGDAGDQGVVLEDGAAGDGAVVPCIGGLTSITLAPANMMVTLDGTAPAPISFTATGTFADGHMETLDPTQLGWKVERTDDTAPGMIANGTLQPNGQAGGTVTVSGADGCGVTGSTTVVFHLDVTVGTNGNPTAWMGAPVITGTLPVVVYPSDQTRFPRNIYRTLFQWRSAYTQFRLTFEGPNSKVTVYTDGVNPLCVAPARCWEADEAAWSFIAGSNAGATAAWTLDALDTSTATPTVRRASFVPPGGGAAKSDVTLGFSRRNVEGAIFYWSTTVAGVRRANIRDAVPENYIAGSPQTTYPTPAADAVKCVACHVVSRDGKYLAAPVDATSGKSLWITEVTTTAPPKPLVKTVAGTGGHGFATISPDDAHVAVAWGGPMWTVDRVTGVKEADIPLGVLEGTHPDWSPDNTQLVFATGRGDAPGGAAIAVVPYLNPGWGTVSTLVPAGGLSNLFPMFSPDGNWIAYSRGKGGHGDLSAQLWVVGKAGSAAVELVSSNCVVSNKKDTTATASNTCKTENNQPTWAPPGDLYWVAFNSTREYGVVAKAGTQQIWVAAIDPAKLGTGADPSYPAFRLQFQGLNEDNHRAFWTLDVRDPPDGGAPPDLSPPGDMAKMCIASGKTCDPIADRCCLATERCDTNDNGATYNCIAPIP